MRKAFPAPGRAARRTMPYKTLVLCMLVMIILAGSCITMAAQFAMPTFADSGVPYDDAFFRSKFDTIHEIDLSTVVAGTDKYPGVEVNNIEIRFSDEIVYDPNTAYRITGSSTTRHITITADSSETVNSLETDLTVNLILNGVSIESTSSPLSLMGDGTDVTLWLSDGTTNYFMAKPLVMRTFAPGILVMEGRTLTIHGSATEATGKLNASASDQMKASNGSVGYGAGAGIGGWGGNLTSSCGTVNIYGGHITAQGGAGGGTEATEGDIRPGFGGGGAGIGGGGGNGANSISDKPGAGGNGGTVTIAGTAIVNATGASAAGIGGGSAGGACLQQEGTAISRGTKSSGGEGGTIRILGEAEVSAFGAAGIGGGVSYRNKRDQYVLGSPAAVSIDHTATVKVYSIHHTIPAIHATNNENKSGKAAWMISGCFGAALDSNPQIRVYDLEEPDLPIPPKAPTDEPRMILTFPSTDYAYSFACTAPDQEDDGNRKYVCIADHGGHLDYIVRLNSDSNDEYNGTRISTKTQYDIHASQSLARKNLWILQKVTVSFDSNGGTPTPSSQSLYEGEKVAEPVQVTRSNDVLDGWRKEDVTWDFETDTVGTRDLTLMANWLTACTVTFHPNGGVFENDSSTTARPVIVGNSQSVDAPDVIKEGYVFGGWYTSNSIFTDENKREFPRVVTEDLTVYARWLDACTVRFDVNGSDSRNPPDQVVALGEYIAEPQDPVRNDYVFIGWFQTGAVSKWNFGRPVEAADADNAAAPYTMQLTAKWGKPAVNLHVRQIIVGEKTSLALPQAGYLTMNNGVETYGLVVESDTDDTDTENYTRYLLTRGDRPFTIDTILPAYYRLDGPGYRISTTAEDNGSSPYETGVLDLSSAEFAVAEALYITIYITPVMPVSDDPEGWFEKPYSWDYNRMSLGII